MCFSTPGFGTPQKYAEADLYTGYLAGLSAIIYYIESMWRPVALLCDRLAHQFLFTGVNVYLTPAGGNVALPPHTDEQDVFLLQISGSKRWLVFPPPYEVDIYKEHVIGKPHSRRRFQKVKVKSLGSPELNFTMRQGDVLYIPRGHPHYAVSLPDELSMHLTITVGPHLSASLHALALPLPFVCMLCWSVTQHRLSD